MSLNREIFEYMPRGVSRSFLRTDAHFFAEYQLLPPQQLAQRPNPEEAIIVIRAYIQYKYSIHRKNLDLTKVGAQIVSGVVRNARKWVSGGVIKFPVR